jgi:hypothetical protein
MGAGQMSSNVTAFSLLKDKYKNITIYINVYCDQHTITEHKETFAHLLLAPITTTRCHIYTQ